MIAETTSPLEAQVNAAHQGMEAAAAGPLADSFRAQPERQQLPPGDHAVLCVGKAPDVTGRSRAALTTPVG